MSKIALAIICGCAEGEEKRLDRMLTSVAPHVDGLFITFTKPEAECGACREVAEKYHANISYGDFTEKITKKQVEWLTQFLGYVPHGKVGDTIFRFDNARNASFQSVPKDYDWILWLDTDDILLGGENLHTLAEKGLEDGVEAYYFNYLYQIEPDEQGRVKHVLIQHLRERLVRNTDVYEWVAPIHETLIEKHTTVKMDTPACEVVHLADDKDRVASMMRNLKNLEFSIYEKRGKDPRPLYYLAKIYFDLNTEENNRRAIDLIMKYLTGEHQSGWPEERAQAWEYLSEIYRRLGEYNNAVKSCMNGLIEVPDIPSLFLSLALTYVYKQEWENALLWVKIASQIPEKKTTLVSNPKDLQTKTLEILFNASLQTHKIDNAWAAAQKLNELHPGNESVTQNLRLVESLRTERELTKNMLALADYLKKTGEYPKLKALLAAAPQQIQTNPFFINLYQENNPPKAWGDDEIAIYCGQGFTPWGPQYMRNPKGTFMGGSEEAVVCVSEALAKQGWKVTVYNDCGEDEGTHNGVAYKPYFAFNRVDNFNILIGWRDIRFFDTKFSAKKTYLWCHDIQNPLDFMKERVDNITKVMFLSDWHRSNVPSLPDDKVFLTSNGL